MEILGYSSGHKLLYSNSAILYDKNADFLLDIKVSEAFSFKIRIEFEESKKGGISKTINSETNEILLKMHDKLVSTLGPAEPIQVARVNDKPLLFQFVIQRLYNGEYKKIDYTFYEG